MTQLADLPNDDPFTLEESYRFGQSLLTLYRESQPIGSLLIDPVNDKSIYNEFREFTKRLNALDREQREKKRNSEQDGKRKRRDGEDF